MNGRTQTEGEKTEDAGESEDDEERLDWDELLSLVVQSIKLVNAIIGLRR